MWLTSDGTINLRAFPTDQLVSYDQALAALAAVDADELEDLEQFVLESQDGVNEDIEETMAFSEAESAFVDASLPDEIDAALDWAALTDIDRRGDALHDIPLRWRYDVLVMFEDLLDEAKAEPERF